MVRCFSGVGEQSDGRWMFQRKLSPSSSWWFPLQGLWEWECFQDKGSLRLPKRIFFFEKFQTAFDPPALVSCPTIWSLYWYLSFCNDHLSQHPDNRETWYSNVLPPPPPPHFANHIANFEGHIDVCAFWYNFTIKYILNIKRNLLYIFWNVCAFWYNFTIKYIPNI